MKIETTTASDCLPVYAKAFMLGLRLMTGIGLLFCVALPCSARQAESSQPVVKWPGRKSKFNAHQRFDFKVAERNAYVVVPKYPAPGNPWVWRARFPTYHAEADSILLERGFHVGYINTNGMFGSPGAMKHWDAFYQFMTGQGLSKQVALEGVSRGGLFVYAFAARWPERVACIYADTPVLDVRSWPGGKGAGRGHSVSWEKCLEEYGLTETESEEFKRNPIDRLEPIAKQKIPLLHIVSMNDEIVPPAENTQVLVDRYRELGGAVSVIKVESGTAKSGGHHFTHPNPLRVADFIERHSTALPGSKDYFQLRGTLNNSRIKFTRDKKGRVAFVGGSITFNPGWREQTQEYLKKRFPETEFDFIDAGISSTGSTPAAFRLQNDVLSRGQVDLLFEEAAVNDLHNLRTPIEMIRGMEGVVRRARRSNPKMDIVIMHCVDPRNFKDYHAGRVPPVIVQHEKVASRYQIPTVHWAREVNDRLDAKQFSWKQDFKNLHPSPYGQRLYASTLRRMFSTVWEPPSEMLPSKTEPSETRHSKTESSKTQPLEPQSSELQEMKSHAELGQPLDEYCYDQGRYFAFDSLSSRNGFESIESCDVTAGGVGGRTREGFTNVPMLVGSKPGDWFEFEFTGRGFGLMVAAGPDAGVIEFKIDDADWQQKDLFTGWSRGLHIPWTYVLASKLQTVPHKVKLRISEKQNPKSKGHACRIVRVLVNE